MENGKRDYRSHQGASHNGPWERLAWTQRTLGRVNEKNETPRRFGSISVQRIPISGFGLWTGFVALFWGRIMSHKHKNLSYLLASTFQKFKKFFFRKTVVLFTRTVWTGDFVLPDELVNFPFAKKHSKWFFFFLSSLAQITFRHFEIVICEGRFSLRLSHDT